VGGPYDFTGRLSFDWPASDCLPQQGGVQFPRGYGLSLRTPSRLGTLPDVPVSVCPPETR
jgi:beta-glucosidase